jgi:hypothetical protein
MTTTKKLHMMSGSRTQKLLGTASKDHTQAKWFSEAN